MIILIDARREINLSAIDVVVSRETRLKKLRFSPEIQFLASYEHVLVHVSSAGSSWTSFKEQISIIAEVLFVSTQKRARIPAVLNILAIS